LNFNHPCKELIWAHRVGCFNGANGSTFLTYASDGDWASALQTAAENLARSMIKVTGDTLASGATQSSDVTFVDTDTVFTYQNGNSTLRFTVVTAPSSSSFTITVPVVLNALQIGSSNLCDKLGTVSYDLTYASGVAAAPLSVSVSVSGHSLTLDDLSIPISAMTDYRYAKTKSADIAVVQLNNYGLRLDGKGNMVTQGQITLNGHERFSIQTGAYFNYLEPNVHHTRTPADGINVYSFGLHPEQHQPTGTCNMSRIDSCRLVYKVKDILNGNRSASGVFNIYTGTIVYVYVTNYNILRMMAGMAGVAYSN